MSQKAGLTRNEVKIYLVLLELKQSTKGPIIKKTKIHSSKVYESLQRLINKGLVSFVIKSGVKYFQPANPERLLDYLDERKKTIEKHENMIKNVLPQLSASFKQAKVKYTVEVYEGIKGLRSAFYDALNHSNKDDEIYSFGIPQVPEEVEIFFESFNNRRIKLEIKEKKIFNIEATEMGNILAKNHYTEVKYLPKGLATPATINIYRQEVLIVLGILKEPLCIKISGNEIARSFKNYFKLLWKQAGKQPIKTGKK